MVRDKNQGAIRKTQIMLDIGAFLSHFCLLKTLEAIVLETFQQMRDTICLFIYLLSHHMPCYKIIEQKLERPVRRLL